MPNTKNTVIDRPLQVELRKLEMELETEEMKKMKYFRVSWGLCVANFQLGNVNRVCVSVYEE